MKLRLDKQGYRFVRHQNSETTHIVNTPNGEKTLCGKGPDDTSKRLWVECGSVTYVNTQCENCFAEWKQIILASREEH